MSKSFSHRAPELPSRRPAILKLLSDLRSFERLPPPRSRGRRWQALIRPQLFSVRGLLGNETMRRCVAAASGTPGPNVALRPVSIVGKTFSQRDRWQVGAARPRAAPAVTKILRIVDGSDH